tara:strand:+ start:55124 stop:55363 length:240 start_codon:yes stop_codon:yes gene_type:complete
LGLVGINDINLIAIKSPEKRKRGCIAATPFFMAEGQGFEPWVPCDTSVFKTGAFDHSAIPPKNIFGGFSLENTEVHPEA